MKEGKFIQLVSQLKEEAELLLLTPNQSPNSRESLCDCTKRGELVRLLLGFLGAQGKLLDDTLDAIKVSVIFLQFFSGNIATLSNKADAIYFYQCYNVNLIISGAQTASAFRLRK